MDSRASQHLKRAPSVLAKYTAVVLSRCRDAWKDKLRHADCLQYLEALCTAHEHDGTVCAATTCVWAMLSMGEVIGAPEQDLCNRP